MRTAVLLALWDDDSTLLRQIDAERDLYVSRRCADISELLADVAVGLGQLAIIDEQLDGLDRTVIATLNSYGVPAIVLTRNDGVRWHDLGLGWLPGQVHPSAWLLKFRGFWLPAQFRPSPLLPPVWVMSSLAFRLRQLTTAPWGCLACDLRLLIL